MSADPINPAAEADRLRKTIVLAEEALRCAADLRSARHAPGETAGETGARWFGASQIEEAAKHSRLTARAALAALRVFPDKRTPEQIAEAIAEAKAAALALKAACDDAQAAQNRRSLRLAARDLKRAVAEAAAAEAAAKKGGAL